MKLWVHSAALDELDEVAVWYDGREPGLGDELVAEVQEGLRRIEEVICICSRAAKPSPRRGSGTLSVDTAR